MITIALGILLGWFLIVTIEWWLPLLIKLVCYGTLIIAASSVIYLFGLGFGVWA